MNIGFNMNYVFTTYFMTSVCFSKSGTLFHVPAVKADPNLVCDDLGQPNGEVPFTVKRIGQGPGYSLQTKDGYLCAEPGGNIAFRPYCSAWETFTLLPVSAIEDAKIAARPVFSRRSNQPSIAKIIHQTYSSNNIPKESIENIELLRQRNPNWEHRYWSDQDCHDFIYKYYGWDILNLYLKINPRYGAARADFFRYLCIYELGGAYLDIKSGSVVPLDDIILPDDQFLISQWQNGPEDRFKNFGIHPELSSIPGGEYQQWHVIAAAGHPFLEYVLNAVIANITSYIDTIHSVGGAAVLRITGPIPYTLAIHRNITKHPYRIFDAERDGLVFVAVKDRPTPEHGSYSIQNTPLVL